MDEVELNLVKDYYLQGDYSLASQSYEGLLKNNPDNPYLLTNLGSSCFQEQEYGKALNSFYKAKKVLPRSKTINNNIQLVNDKVTASQPLFFSYNFLTLNEALIIFLVFNLIFVFKRYISKNKLWLRFVSFAFLLSLSLGTATYLEQKQTKFATVNSISASAYSGNDENFSQIFELIDGQIVKVIREDESWMQIKHQDQLGWVKSKNLEII